MSDPAAPPDAGHPKLQLRVYLDAENWFGPGKADLLELIRETGSISAAGRRMGMSYKRAWTLVETLNAMFAEPLVESLRGGAHGGGARLTPLGEEMLACFRRLQSAARKATRAEIAVMMRAAGDVSGRK